MPPRSTQNNYDYAQCPPNNYHPALPNNYDPNPVNNYYSGPTNIYHSGPANNYHSGPANNYHSGPANNYRSAPAPAPPPPSHYAEYDYAQAQGQAPPHQHAQDPHYCQHHHYQQQQQPPDQFQYQLPQNEYSHQVPPNARAQPNRRRSARKPPPHTAPPSHRSPHPQNYVPSPSIQPPPRNFGSSAPKLREARPANSSYYRQPPPRDRKPEILHNQECGEKYKATAKLRLQDMKMLQAGVKSPIFELMSVLCNSYHNRNNAIPGPKTVPMEEIAAIFRQDFIGHEFPVVEVMKRWTMRQNQLQGKDVACLNWWMVPRDTQLEFVEWVKTIGSVSDPNGQYEDIQLFRFGEDDDENLFILVEPTRISLNFVQMVNVFSDIAWQWNHTPVGSHFIHSSTAAPAFQMG